MRSEDLIKGQLVSYGWRFGQSYTGGHLAGQMVMHTIAERVRQGWGSWLQVLERLPNFMAENELPPLVYPSLWEPTFVKLLNAVDGVYDNSVPNPARGALYWADLNRVQRPWFKEKILGAMVPQEAAFYTDKALQQPYGTHSIVANMNSLTFFR